MRRSCAWINAFSGCLPARLWRERRAAAGGRAGGGSVGGGGGVCVAPGDPERRPARECRRPGGSVARGRLAPPPGSGPAGPGGAGRDAKIGAAPPPPRRPAPPPAELNPRAWAAQRLARRHPAAPPFPPHVSPAPSARGRGRTAEPVEIGPARRGRGPEAGCRGRRGRRGRRGADSGPRGRRQGLGMRDRRPAAAGGAAAARARNMAAIPARGARDPSVRAAAGYNPTK